MEFVYYREAILVIYGLPILTEMDRDNSPIAGMTSYEMLHFSMVLKNGVSNYLNFAFATRETAVEKLGGSIAGYR